MGLGRHVISVTITGNSSDFDRAVRKTQKGVAELGDQITQLGKQSELSRRLRANAREIGRFGASIRKQYGQIEGLGEQLDLLRNREAIRIKTIMRIETATDRLRKFGLVTGIATTGLAAWNGAALAGAAAGAALSGMLVGVGGVGLIGAMGLLYLKTEEGAEAFKKLGGYIKNDLLNKTLAPFYKEFGKLPKQLKAAYNGVRPILSDMGDSLADGLKQVAGLLPSITTSFAQLGRSIADAGAAGFSKELVKGLGTLADGVTRFFDAFAKNGDPRIMGEVFQTLADGIANLGEYLSTITLEEFKATWQRLGDVLSMVWETIKKITAAIRLLDEGLQKLSGGRLGLEDLIVPMLGLWAASKLLVGPISALSKLWQALNIGKIAANIGKLVPTLGPVVPKLSGIAKLLGTVAKKAGPIGLLITAIMGAVDAIRDFGDETTWLGQLWAGTIEPLLDELGAAWDELSTAASEAWAEIKAAWDELYRELDRAGAVDAVKTLAEWFGKLVKAVAGLAIIGAISAYLKALVTVLKVAAGVVKAVAKVFGFFIGGLADAIGSINNTQDAIREWWNSLGDGQGIIEAVGGWFANMAATIDGLMQGIVSAIDGAWQTITGTISGALGNIVGAIQGGFGQALAAAYGIAMQFVGVGRSIVSGVIAGIASMVGSLVSTAVNMAKSAYNAAKNALGINSPSKVFIPIGEAIPEGVAVGVVRATGKAVASIDKMSKQLLKAADGKKAKKKTKKALAAFREELKAYKTTLREAVDAWEDWRAQIGKPVYKKGSIDQLLYNIDRLSTAYDDAAAAAQELRDVIAGPSAFQKEWDRLADSIASIENDIQNLTGLLAELGAPTAIERLADAWDNATAALDSARSAYESWIDEISTSSEESLRQAYDEALAHLNDLRSAAASWAKSVADTVTGVFDFGGAAGSRDMLRVLERQAQAAKDFAAQFAKMQKMGASTELLDQIRAAGVEGGLQIMSQLASPAALAKANELVADVAKVAEQLGADSAAAIYDNDIALAEQALQAKTDALTQYYQNQLDMAAIAEQTARDKYEAQIEWELAQKQSQLEREQAALDAHLAAELAKREAAEAAALAAADEAWTKYLDKLKKKNQNVINAWNKAVKASGKKTGKKYGKQFKKALKQEIAGLDIGGGIAHTSANGRNVVMAIKAYERSNGAGWRR